MLKPILIEKEQGEVWNVLGETIICKVRGDETFGRLAVVEETSPPKGVIPRGTTHSLKNTLATPSKMLAIITPSGFENFFAEISKLEQPDPEKIVEIGKRNDLELAM